MSYYSSGGGSDSLETDAPRRDDSYAGSTPTSPTGYFSSSLYSAFGGLMRRLSSDPNGNFPTQSSSSDYLHHSATLPTLPTTPTTASSSSFLQHSASSPNNNNNGVDGVYTPPAIATRTASPLLLRPPPLEPLTLSGFSSDTPASARLLTGTVAEEIRIMVPERLRIEDNWKLAYSLDQDGASLATLYEKAARYDEHRIGFVLVVKDQEGGIFGAYLTEYPRPSSHYFGTGECFLWRAAVLAARPSQTTTSSGDGDLLLPDLVDATTVSSSTQPPRSTATATPPHPPPSPSIRFSAFPYSGVNEYFIYCEAHSLSIGGGDGRYGLWLNDSLEKGISSTCLTFGNQPLSEEGEKFGVLGVELWVIGSRRR